MNVRTYLEQQQVHPQLIRAVEEFRNQYPVEEKVKYRVSDPMMPFYGTEILEMGIAALLQKENLLLSGSKATGKNVLAENLAWIFQRPTYNISFHVNTGSGDLIGTDTFEDNQVKLRKGSIYQCAEYGGFGILDEINMAKNDAVSVLHATLDYRRSIDVPGYDKIELHPAARFIGTMNYGYAGTKELNEALVSRFLVIQMPDQNEETLEKYLPLHSRRENRKPSNSLSDFSGSAKKGGERRNIHKSSGSSRNPCFVAGDPPGTETVSGCEDGCDQ